MKTQNPMKTKLAFAIAITLAACTSHQKNNEDKQPSDTAQTIAATPQLDLTIPPLPEDYVKTKLSKMGLKATMMTVKGVDMQASELDDNQGARPEYLINAFKMPTGDTARDSMFGGLSAQIEIYTTKWSLKQHLDYEKSSVLTGLKRVLKEENDFVIYSTKQNNSSFQPIRANDSEVFHFIFVVKNEKDNQFYCVRTNSSYDLNLDEMLKLFSIAKTIEWE